MRKEILISFILLSPQISLKDNKEISRTSINVLRRGAETSGQSHEAKAWSEAEERVVIELAH